MSLLNTSRGTHTLPKLQSVIDKWILHQETSAPSGHCELVKVKQAPPEARLRQLSPSKGKCAWGCTISLFLAFQSNPESPWTVTKGKDHFVVFPVAPLRPCCAHTWQSKRPLSVQIVHSRICNNLLSSLFIYNYPTNITIMVVPFAPPTAWYRWIRPIGHGQPLRKGLGKNNLAWFSIKRYYNREINLILLLLVFSMNRSHAVKNGHQNGIHHRRRVPILYK